MESKYGNCLVCGFPLEPIWFTEKEYVTHNGIMCETGRTRRAVDFLVCSHCLHRECVDDSFDGPWR